MEPAIIQVPNTIEGEAMLVLFGGKTLFDSVERINKMFAGKFAITVHPMQWDRPVIVVPSFSGDYCHGSEVGCGILNRIPQTPVGA